MATILLLTKEVQKKKKKKKNQSRKKQKCTQFVVVAVRRYEYVNVFHVSYSIHTILQ